MREVNKEQCPRCGRANTCDTVERDGNQRTCSRCGCKWWWTMDRREHRVCWKLDEWRKASANAVLLAFTTERARMALRDAVLMAEANGVRCV